ncbi:FAD-dependent monooxygenase [Nocardia brevicatena]|uniref:FAD-dependent monooxygenase n=1 Tax=Nocardia brevicatena TaxID=37327 RepID=UPI0003035C18|nr:FAD-dependent monooxygenase [Nocardia brevicatena]
MSANSGRGPRRAIVAGAGIGGLATAAALCRRGWDVEIFERADAVGEAGSGLTLWPNGLRALDVIGLGAAVREQAIAGTDSGIRDPGGRWLIRTDTGELVRRYGEAVMISRSDLFAILHRAVPDARLRLRVAVSGIETVGRRVRVVHSAGVSEADLVVGADGIHSAVRRWVCPDARGPRYAGYTAWRMITSRPVPPLREGGETWGHGERVGIVALADGRVYMFGAADAAAGQRGPGGELAELRRRFDEWHDPIPALLDAVDEKDVLRHDIYELPPLPTYVRGRVALLGDAAHAMTSNMGQGANQGLEDAVTLAVLLDRPGDIEDALDEYDRVRRPRTQSIAARSRHIGGVAQWNSIASMVRDAALRLIPARALVWGMGSVMVWEPPDAGDDLSNR